MAAIALCEHELENDFPSTKAGGGGLHGVYFKGLPCQTSFSFLQKGNDSILLDALGYLIYQQPFLRHFLNKQILTLQVWSIDLESN